ncbi:mucin-13-like [Anabas testudineus]|uniref:mucin-13-like n=1 Tax=Anabas testudineus TaxID=64144 RepID=UPI000E459059|nr:mucin-13-like [Anabas testudineus]
MARTFRLLLVLLLVVASSCVDSEGQDETTDSSTTATEATTTSTAATTTSTEATTTSTAATTTSTEATTTSTAATTTSDGSGTAAPDATTVSVETTVASDNTATTPSDSTASVTSGSGDSATTQVPSTATPTEPSENPCDSNPCGRGSTCDPRANETYVCLCLPGMAYNNISKSCNNAKVFPGQLSLSDIKYNDKMKDKTSEEFLEASEKISSTLSGIFAGSGYSETIVLAIEPIQTRKVESREEPGVSATVDIVFNVDSEITTKDLNDKIEAVGGTFTEGNLCSGACDLDTMTCTSGNGTYTCTCKENYVKTDFSDRVCIACPSGQKWQDSDCVNCPFGYSGLNCNESWQLALVITGSVLGGLLLIALIVLPIVSVKCAKKSSKSSGYEDNGKSYVSPTPAKLPLVNGNSQAQPVNGSGFVNPGVPKIPRATTTNNWDSRTNLEMTPSNSRQNLIPADRNSRLYNDPDDMNPYAQSRPSGYGQARPQNNPYAQSRPQVNPYAQSQGQGNSYYSGSRFS